jgi:hypothetical protein
LSGIWAASDTCKHGFLPSCGAHCTRMCSWTLNDYDDEEYDLILISYVTGSYKMSLKLCFPNIEYFTFSCSVFISLQNDILFVKIVRIVLEIRLFTLYDRRIIELREIAIFKMPVSYCRKSLATISIC